MATKITVLNDENYEPYVAMGMVLAARALLTQPISSNKKRFARAVLREPMTYVQTFKRLIIVGIDTSNWNALSETQIIAATQAQATIVFSEAGNTP